MSVASNCVCSVHLLHPASSRTLIHVVSPDAKVDVGTIAAHFSLQPASLRFNGHFISRDANFISGLTWRQLISFFLSRGFSSGCDLNPVRLEGYPISGVIAEASCDEEHQKAKRTAAECHFGSPLKRVKRENRQGSRACASPENCQVLIPCSESKRERTEELCMWNKRVQHEFHSDGEEACQGHEGKAILGSKRHVPSDDVLGDTPLQKRMKEIRV